MPGVPKEVKDADIDDGQVAQVEAIIRSMTPRERGEPVVIDGVAPGPHRPGQRDHHAGREPVAAPVQRGAADDAIPGARRHARRRGRWRRWAGPPGPGPGRTHGRRDPGSGLEALGGPGPGAAPGAGAGAGPAPAAQGRPGSKKKKGGRVTPKAPGARGREHSGAQGAGRPRLRGRVSPPGGRRATIGGPWPRVGPGTGRDAGNRQWP